MSNEYYLHYQFIRPAFNMNFSSYYSNPYSILNASTFNVMNLNFEQQYCNLSLKGERYFNPSYMQSMTPWMELSNIGIGSYLTNLTAQMPPQAFLARQSSLNPYQSILSPVNPVQTPGTVVGNGNGDGDPEAEELTISQITDGTKQHNKLKTLQTLLENYSTYTEDEDTQILINTTLNRLEGAANQESFTETKEFFEKVENDYKTLTELYKKLDTKDIKEYILEEEFGEELRKTGYKFETGNGDIISNVSDFRKAIDKIEDNGSISANDYEGSLTESDILNFISTWNDEEEGKYLIEYIAEKCNFEKKHEDRSNNILPVIKSITTQLINKANHFDGDIEDDIKELNEKRKALVEAISAAEKKNENGKYDKHCCTKEQLDAINDAFNELYVCLRQLEAKEIDKEISKQYEFLDDLDPSTDDDNIINNDDILKESEEDMKKNEKLSLDTSA